MDCKSVRPRGLIGFHGSDYIDNFDLRNGTTKCCIFFRVNEKRDIREEVNNFLVIALDSIVV